MWKELFQKIQAGDTKTLARSISLIENEYDGYEQLLTQLTGNKKINIINVLIHQIINIKKLIMILIKLPINIPKCLVLKDLIPGGYLSHIYCSHQLGWRECMAEEKGK